MKRNELDFTNYCNKMHSDFIIRCLTPSSWEDDKFSILIESSSTTEEFINKLLNDEGLKTKQAYAEVSKLNHDGKHWYRVRSMFNEVHKVYSDAGSLKVGNKEFTVLLPNGYGDGLTRFAVVNYDDSFNSNMMKFFTSIEGKFYVYSYDCGDDFYYVDEEPLILDGRFGIYFHEGIIAFVRWK